MSHKTPSPEFRLSILPDELRALIQHDREQTLADWQRLHHPATLTTAQAAVRCGRVRADGTPNITAFKMFLARHPDLPRNKAGRRLVFDAVALDQWLTAQPMTARQGARHGA
jgi:hypothetical protein